MSQLIRYTCSKCAGALIVDKEQEVLECPFCGASFGITEFQQDDVLGDGEAALHRMEFSAAKDKFEHILKADPSNFTALRGLIFAEGQVNSLAYIQRVEKLRRCNREKMNTMIDYALAHAREDDEAYFRQLQEMISLYDEYQALDQKNRSLASEQRKELESIHNITGSQEAAQETLSKAGEFAGNTLAAMADDNDKENAEVYIIIFVIALIALGSALAISWLGMWGIPVCILIAIIAFVIRGFVLGSSEAKKEPHKEAVRTIANQISETTRMEQEIEKRYSDAYTRLKELDPTKKEGESGND